MEGIDWIGENGPVLLVCLAIIQLYKKPFYFYVYIIGIVVNSLSNVVLKRCFREPRPNDSNKSTFYIEQKYGKENIEDKRYGMPSGHSQSVLFTTVFLFTVTRKWWIFLLCLIISAITLYQRIKSSSHSLVQVAVGSILGAVVGFVFYKYGVYNIPKHIQKKIEDNAPF